jgi:hypothetical protein
VIFYDRTTEKIRLEYLNEISRLEKIINSLRKENTRLNDYIRKTMRTNFVAHTNIETGEMIGPSVMSHHTIKVPVRIKLSEQFKGYQRHLIIRDHNGHVAYCRTEDVQKIPVAETRKILERLVEVYLSGKGEK